MSKSQTKPDDYYDMTPERVEHLAELLTWMRLALHEIHYKGQETHGGSIFRRACFPKLKPELFDALTYWYEHSLRMQQWKLALGNALTYQNWDKVVQVVKEIEHELGPETDDEVFPDRRSVP